MLNITPGVLDGIALQGGWCTAWRILDRKSPMGCCWVAAREAFSDMASPSSPTTQRVLLERKQKHTLLPKLIVQLGLPIFLPLVGLCIRPMGVGLQACFVQGVCLWVTLNYHHNSKNYTYILSAWLKSWGIVSNYCLPNYLRLQSSGVSTESRRHSPEWGGPCPRY